MTRSDTIHALATAQGRAGVAVIRISGPATDEILAQLTGYGLPVHRTMALRTVRDERGDVLDRGLVVRFPEDGSFTGEAIGELHLHGSRAVVRAVLRRLERLALSRLAQPGEFTRRAFRNRRLDLTQVQALGDLLDAETELQRKAAMRVFDGELSRVVEAWRCDLIEAVAYLEATIDFVDEDVPEDVSRVVRERTDRVSSSISQQLRGVDQLRSLKNGFTVAIVGRPNAGKSSLLNAISRRDVALVSDIPGTTRDVLEIQADLSGLAVTFLDTAGLRDSHDPIERLGVERAMQRAAGASLTVLLYDARDSDTNPTDLGVAADICVRTKTDLTGTWGVSSVSGQGIDELLGNIRSCLQNDDESDTLVSEARDEADLIEAMAYLRMVQSEPDTLPEIDAENIRAAIATLSGVIGAVDNDDILDHIFRAFCLGK